MRINSITNYNQKPSFGYRFTPPAEYFVQMALIPLHSNPSEEMSQLFRSFLSKFSGMPLTIDASPIATGAKCKIELKLDDTNKTVLKRTWKTGDEKSLEKAIKLFFETAIKKEQDIKPELIRIIQARNAKMSAMGITRSLGKQIFF